MNGKLARPYRLFGPTVRALAALLIMTGAGRAAPAFDARHTEIAEVDAAGVPTLAFSYRIWPLTKVVSTDVQSGGRPLPAKVTAFAENPANTTALLILVDNSIGQPRSPRSGMVEANKQIIADILARAREGASFGLFTYANDLSEVAPLDRPPAEIRQKLSGVRADAMGARLYKRAIEAVEKLGAHPAKRKALLVFSTGKEEDSSIKPEAVIAAANKAGVMIFAVGCPQSELDTPNLKNLERIALATLGLYEQNQIPPAGIVGPTKNPPGLADKILASLDGGADVTAPLDAVPTDALVKVTVATADGTKLEKTLQRVPPPTPTPTPAPEATPTPEAAPEPAPPTPEPTPQPAVASAAIEWVKANLLWVAVAAAALVVLLVALVALVARAKRPAAPPLPLSPDETASAKSTPPSEDEPAPPPLPAAPPPPARPSEAAAPAPPSMPPPMPSAMPPPVPPEQPKAPVAPVAKPPSALAYLTEVGADRPPIPVTKTSARIGRDSDNDIVLNNDSVSGHHAKLQLDPGGTFTITDLGSNNGILVNGKSAASSPLADGDTIELGDLRLLFTLPV